jgi:hypothetical protein
VAVKTARVDNDVESDPGLEINDSKSLAAGKFSDVCILAQTRSIASTGKHEPQGSGAP